MTTRTTNATVIFQRPFILDGFDSVQPSGSYIVETEEELLDTSFPAWKRIATLMHLTQAGATEYVPVDPEQLDAALLRDGARETAAKPEADVKMWRDKSRLANVARLLRRKRF